MTGPYLDDTSICSQRDIARHAMAKALYEPSAVIDGPWDELADDDKTSWLADVDRLIAAAEANDFRFERDLGAMTKDWHEDDGHTYILMTPSQRAEAVESMEGALDSAFSSMRKHIEKGAKAPTTGGYCRIIEADLEARGYAILPMGNLAFDRAAEIADETEADQERDHGAANTGGAAAAAAAIRAAKLKYYTAQPAAVSA